MRVCCFQRGCHSHTPWTMTSQATVRNDCRAAKDQACNALRAKEESSRPQANTASTVGSPGFETANSNRNVLRKVVLALLPCHLFPCDCTGLWTTRGHTQARHRCPEPFGWDCSLQPGASQIVSVLVWHTVQRADNTARDRRHLARQLATSDRIAL